jgi:hypothetical protein
MQRLFQTGSEDQVFCLVTWCVFIGHVGSQQIMSTGPEIKGFLGDGEYVVAEKS